MIGISLHDIAGDIISLDTPHPEYLDFLVRTPPTPATTQVRVEIADDHYVAPLIASLNGRTAIETYPDLTRTLADIAQKHGHREDATTLLPFLIAASRPYPQARWHVIGGERVPRNVRYIEATATPRAFASSIVSSQERDAKFVAGVALVRLAPRVWIPSNEAVRMDAIDEDRATFTVLEAKLEEVNWSAILQRDTRITPTGGGSRSKNRKKPPKAGDLPLTGSAGYDEPIRRAVLSMRVDATAKEALLASGVGRELIETLGRAIASGRTIDDVRAALGETA